MIKRVSAVIALALVLGACGARPAPATYEEAAWAGALCVDGSYVRVPDTYCPIGDEVVAGHPYFWAYREYTDRDRDIDVVYVGYPVERGRWVNTRPARVSTLRIDRGSYPERPAAGQAQTSQVRVETAAEKRRKLDAAKGITRGGLGVGTPVPDKAPVAKAATPPAPKSRPQVSPKSRKSR
jgi:hypothetical protein